jgi:ABC-2 type transport system ATP-binding protein
MSSVPNGTTPFSQHPPNVQVIAARALTVEGVTVRYGANTALSDVSLVVRHGEAIALVGENGAGKSTLLQLCAGLLRPSEGRVRRGGTVGYCPQDPALFDLLNAGEHLVLFGAARGHSRRQAVQDGRELLEGLGFPVGSQTLVRDLSGGARQKLNLALALLGRPDLLLLDEPYQGFDHGSYIDFWGLVDRWRDEGRAVVVVTHLLTEANRVDRVVELRRPEERR